MNRKMCSWSPTHSIFWWFESIIIHESRSSKSLKSTEIYINVEQAMFKEKDDDEFHVKVAQKPKEVKALLEVGF